MNNPNTRGRLLRSEWSLRRRLFVYMLILTVILLSILAAVLMLFGRSGSAASEFEKSLDVQMAVFEKDVSVHFDSLAASAISMSEDLSVMLDGEIKESGLPFSSLTDDKERIEEIHELMMEPVRQKLLQAHCSGAFVMLDATVNSSVSPDGSSKTGIYLQVNGYNRADKDIVLYRGNSSVAGERGILPHRKWRLEFTKELVPGFDFHKENATLQLENAFRLTPLVKLPGTSDRAVYLTIPVVGENGEFYGVCGYEISESYFGTYHAQPSKLAHLSCLLTEAQADGISAQNGLVCGTGEGYFRIFGESLEISRSMGALTVYSDNVKHIGITKAIKLTPTDEGHALTVMIPKSDYDRAVSKHILRTAAVFVLILFFTVSFCWLFSRRFLAPVQKALERIKSDKRSEEATNITEIDDLFIYLDSRDKENDKRLSALEEKSRAAEAEKVRLEGEYKKAQGELEAVQNEIKRLAYSRKNEIDPEDYSFFVAGIKTLTDTERRIFDLYLSGKSAAEILKITGVKESTLKFHNHNILGKLGVSSRKQMLRFAEVMRHENDNNTASDQS